MQIYTGICQSDIPLKHERVESPPLLGIRRPSQRTAVRSRGKVRAGPFASSYAFPLASHYYIRGERVFVVVEKILHDCTTTRTIYMCTVVWSVPQQVFFTHRIIAIITVMHGEAQIHGYHLPPTIPTETPNKQAGPLTSCRTRY